METQLEWGQLYKDNDTGEIKKWFSPHEGQQEILNQQDARFLLALGGVNSGKTSMGCLWLALEILKHQGRGDYLVVAPTWGVVLSSTYKQWDKVIKGWAPFAGEWHPHQTNPRYQLDSGGTIYFRSSDGNFNGLKPNAILLDEGGDIKEETFNEIKGRMTTGGRLLISTTPYAKHDWIKFNIMEQADNGNPQYFYKCLPSILNPMTDLQHIEEEKKRLQPWEFEMRYLGKYTRPPSQVYDLTNCFVDIPDDGFPHALAYFAGVDFGGNDPTAVVVGFLDEADCLWIFWEYYAKENQDIEKFLTDMRQFNEQFKKQTNRSITYFCDHRPEIINALKRNNLDARKANKKKIGRNGSIEVGISLIQARIRTGRLKIVKGACPNLKIEAGKYRYPMSDGQVIGNLPIDKDNHLCFPAGELVDTPNGRTPIEKLRVGDKVYSHLGIATVEAAAKTGIKEIVQINLSDNTIINCTPEHPFRLSNGDWLEASQLSGREVLIRCKSEKKQPETETRLKSLNTTGTFIEDIQTTKTNISFATPKAIEKNCIDKYTSTISGKFQKDITFTIKTGTKRTTPLITLLPLHRRNIGNFTKKTLSRQTLLPKSGMVLQRGENGIENTGLNVGLTDNREPLFVNGVTKNTNREIFGNQLDSAPTLVNIIPELRAALMTKTEIALSAINHSVLTVMSKRKLAPKNVEAIYVREIKKLNIKSEVFNISTSDGTFFVNGVLTSNCDAMRYLVSGCDRQELARASKQFSY